jgi:hypothetical protein
MEEKARKEKDYLNLGRTLAENHFKTEAAKAEKPVPPPTGKPIDEALFRLNVFFHNSIGSVIRWFYHYIRSRFGKKHRFRTYNDAAAKGDNGIYRMANSNVKAACAADWASDTPESDIIGRRMEFHSPEYTIHLGDTYFVGSPAEIKHNFINENASWCKGSRGTFALMGNHEMYSRGIGYFDYLLPVMGIKNESGEYTGQKASFFCLENDYWRVIGLDTGYNSLAAVPIIENFAIFEKIPFLGKYLFPKCSLPVELMDWLEKTVKPDNDKRGLIFLSHHQYCSAFERDYNVIGEQLGKFTGDSRPAIWIWGHEHRFSVYGRYGGMKGGKYGKGPCITAYGRCIGHGGMPIELAEEAPSGKIIEQKPLVLYDNRYKETIGGTPVGHNGYMVLNFNNEMLDIDYYDSSRRLLTEKWKANLTTGGVEGINIELEEKELTVAQEPRLAIK